MKKVRLILSASMIALMGISAVTFTSCTKDDDCAVGYTGKNCDEEIRTPMLGNYSASETDDLGESVNYNITISESSSVQEISINHLAALGGGAYLIDKKTVATISENGKNISFNIAYQTPNPIEDVEGHTYSVEGSGSYNSKTEEITVTYTVYQDGNRNSAIKYSGTWTKQ